MKWIIVYIWLLIIANPLKGQERILVAEGTIKISALSEESLYYGFAPGDKVIFNLKVDKRKELKEFEIMEYPFSSRLKDFKTSSIQNKTLSTVKETIFKFRFYNGRLGKRVCSYTIYRIPASDEFKDFNTTVSWITKTDTVWKTFTKNVVVGYDTTLFKQVKKVEVKRTKEEVLLTDKIERVHSTTNSNGNKTWIHFTLPNSKREENKTSQIIAWAYWVGVGEEANTAWAENSKGIKDIVNVTATAFTTPLGALAIGAITDLVMPKMGEDVYYALTDLQSKNLFMAGNSFYVIDKGKGVAGYKRMLDPDLCKGTYFLCFSNDNIMQGVDVNIKVVAIKETIIYEDREEIISKVTPRNEKQIFSEPEITSQLIPIIVK